MIDSPQLENLMGFFRKKPNKEIGEAGLACLVGVFRSDNNFSDQEKEDLARMLREHKFFKLFEKHAAAIDAKNSELNRAFRDYGLDGGLDACHDEMGEIASLDQDTKEGIIRLGIIAGGKDGLSAEEKAFLREGCRRMRVDPAIFPKLAA